MRFLIVFFYLILPVSFYSQGILIKNKDVRNIVDNFYNKKGTYIDTTNKPTFRITYLGGDKKNKFYNFSLDVIPSNIYILRIKSNREYQFYGEVENFESEIIDLKGILDGININHNVKLIIYETLIFNVSMIKNKKIIY